MVFVSLTAGAMVVRELVRRFAFGQLGSGHYGANAFSPWNGESLPHLPNEQCPFCARLEKAGRLRSAATE